MTPIIIGISSGLFIILIFLLLRGLDKRIIYGLILSCIGFLYVGFVWSDTTQLIQNSVQALVFLFIAYFGAVARNIFLLAAGYFLHGIWDIAYGLFSSTELIPPGYDLFCLANRN